MRLRRDRLMIVLRPCAVRHKFRICTSFVAGRPLTSQTAFGGQLPYKGSLVRPAVRFGHSRSEYRVNTGIHISWQSPQKKRFLLFDDFETSKNGNFEVSLLFYSAIDNMTSIELRSQFAKKYTAHGRTVGASRGKPAREISS